MFCLPSASFALFLCSCGMGLSDHTNASLACLDRLRNTVSVGKKHDTQPRSFPAVSLSESSKLLNCLQSAHHKYTVSILYNHTARKPALNCPQCSTGERKCHFNDAQTLSSQKINKTKPTITTKPTILWQHPNSL